MSAESVAESIPPGYKQTEVGVIPEDWEISPLESLTDQKRPISYGIVQTGPNLQNGVRCLRVLDVEDGRINKTNLIITSKEISDTYKRTILKPDDLVMPLRGNVGDVALVDEDLAGCNLTRGVALIAIRSDWSASFCKQFISSSATKKRLEQSMNGSALQEIPIATLRAFKIAFPPTKAEQEAIATALSDTDALIESLEQLIAKKRQVKQGAMQELLTGKKRLPGFEIKHGYKHTEIGMIPLDWEIVHLADVGQNLAGLTYNPSNVRDFGTLVLRSSNIQNGKLVFEDNVYVDMELPERVIVEKDDILICVRNGSRQLIGKCALIDEQASGKAFGAFMSIYRSKHSRYLFYQFQSEIIQRQINEIMGATINQITNKDMASFIVPSPQSDEEKNAIATILSDMDTEITALEEKLAKTRHIKQGMMQELLTGRIRLV